MAVPNVRALQIAADWCDVYEGEDDEERADMAAVVAWLRERADAKLNRDAQTQAVRSFAAERGVTPGQVRRALARKRAAEKVDGTVNSR